MREQPVRGHIHVSLSDSDEETEDGNDDHGILDLTELYPLERSDWTLKDSVFQHRCYNNVGLLHRNTAVEEIVRNILGMEYCKIYKWTKQQYHDIFGHKICAYAGLYSSTAKVLKHWRRECLCNFNEHEDKVELDKNCPMSFEEVIWNVFRTMKSFVDMDEYTCKCNFEDFPRLHYDMTTKDFIEILQYRPTEGFCQALVTLWRSVKNLYSNIRWRSTYMKFHVTKSFWKFSKQHYDLTVAGVGFMISTDTQKFEHMFSYKDG